METEHVNGGSHGVPHGGPHGGDVVLKKDLSDKALSVVRIESEFNAREKEGQEWEEWLVSGFNSIGDSIDASVSLEANQVDHVVEGAGEKELSWNDKVCLVESVRAELRHDNGVNDLVYQLSDYEDSEDENFVPEELESGDEDEGSSEDELMEEYEEEDEYLGVRYGEPHEKERSEEQRPLFMVGQTFMDKPQFKSAIDTYAVKNGYNLKFEKSDRARVRVKCNKECPFVIYASRERSNPGLVVKTVNMEHKCSKVYTNRRCSVKWIAEYFRKKVQQRPQYKISDMKNDLRDELDVGVSIWKCKRAKKRIMKKMEGSYIDEFNNLQAFCNELQVSNPGTDVHLELSKEALGVGMRVFSRIYIFALMHQRYNSYI